MKLKFDEFEVNGRRYKTAYLDNRLNKQDVKIMALTDYKKGHLDFRDELKIISNETFKKGDLLELYCMNSNGKYNKRVGKAIYDRKDGEYVIVKPTKFDDFEKLTDLFKILDAGTDETKNDSEYEKYIKENNDEVIKKYIGEDGLFKYYYESLFSFIENNDNCFNIAKLSALTFYQSAKEYFESQGRVVSLPNVFIKNFDVEFDMLLLKNAKNSKKLFFETDEVEAIIELKTRGIFIQKDELPEKFRDYINFEFNKDKLEKYDNIFGANAPGEEGIISNKYNEIKNKVTDIPYIYCCLDETNRGKTNNPYYETTYNILKGEKKEGIFFVITDDSNHFIVPIKYQK